MSSSSIVLILLSISTNYAFYSNTFILIIGLIGNILNIIIFTNIKIFRKKQRVFYLIIESFVNTFELIFLFIIRIWIWLNNNIDPTNNSLIWCKLRTLIDETFAPISFTIVCFATCDQYLSTSHPFILRQMSTYESTQYIIIISICFWIAHSIPFAVYLENHPPFGCTMINSIYARYYSFFYYPILIGVLPIFISFVFSFLAFHNVRKIICRQIPIIRRRMDQQLTAMILIRVIGFIILVLPYTIHRIYWLNINFYNDESLRYAINQLVLVIIYSFYHFNFGISFYIFSISSSRFRRQVKYVLGKKFWRRFRNNQINPAVLNMTSTSLQLG